MAITLSPELAAAQDSLDRQPLIKLLATQIEDSMPFNGEYFNSSLISERNNCLIESEDGSLIGAFVRNGRRIVQVRTDIARTFWDETLVETDDYFSIQNMGIVELDLERLGVVYTYGRDLKYVILDRNGVRLKAPTTIHYFLSTELPKDPSVFKLEDGSFFLVNIVYNSGTLEYSIQSRTSQDFITWSAPSSIVLTGLLTTRTISNLSLIRTSTELLLFFDYVDLEKDGGLTTISNIYKISSTDNGITWSIPQKITNYTEWGTSCVNPYAVPKADGSVNLAFTDMRKVLSANGDTTLWGNECTGGHTNATNIHFNPATGRLYVYQIHTYVGYKVLCGVVVIDTATWEVIKTYTTQTSPGYNDIFAEEHVWPQKDRGDGEFAVFSTYQSTSCKALCVIDDNLETITEYFFNSNPDREITCNVDITWPVHQSLNIENNIAIRATWTDASTKRVYIMFGYSYLYFRACVLGWIDLQDPIDQATGKYPFHSIFSTSTVFSEVQVMGLEQIIVVPERNCIIVLAASALPGYSYYPGKTTIIDITSGGILKEFQLSTHSSYPNGGVHHACYYNGCLYGSFDYVTIDDQENHRGMIKINLDTEEITYHQPTWKTADDYGLVQKIPTGDGRILVAVNGYPGGVAVFNIDSGSWYLYTKTTLQGFETVGEQSTCYSIAYDLTSKQIMTGSTDGILFSSFVGVRMFDEDGAYNIGKLCNGINSNGWIWGVPENLTLGHSEIDSAITMDSDDVLWSIWTRLDDEEYSAKWDRDVKEMLLDNYLVAGSPVTLNSGLDKTGTLSFTVSHGHLFDPNNLYSTWNAFLKKGKQIEISFGEMIGGVEYWQTQGIFTVDALNISYSRGTYPTMSVSCVSPDNIWGDIQVAATKRYDTTSPEEMVIDLLMEIPKISAQKINIPAFPNSHEIHHQWVDSDFKTIIADTLDHFQCVPFFDANGVFAPKVININKPVDHVYTGAEIIKFSPDDNYSSFVNRIIVTGEGLYFLEVTYEEELMETITGTGGWWDSDEKVVRVDYSKDLDTICYDPRLKVLTSIKDFKILWSRSGGDEYISFVDPNNRYCEVTIVFPGIIDVLLAAIGLLIAVGTMAVRCTVDCGPYIFALSVVSSGINYILGQVASYSYEVYAKPTGEEKQIVSSQVDDFDFQRMLGGLIVPETFDDPFCYTAESCKDVATFEMSVVRSQRNRATFEKIAHLQDEICDKIQIRHPYSKAVLDFFITDLQRVYIRPSKGVSETAAFVDTITGWRL